MLEHLSKARFIKEIADFTHGSEWIYRGINPAVIVFHDSVHLYEKGIRDVYDPLKKLFPQVNFYQVLIDRDPQTAQIYDIQTSPTTMFIPLTGKPLFIPGFLLRKKLKKKQSF
ncbi:MAG: hypothetical protein V8R52_10550 [Coprobacter fastidiosus]